MISMLLPVLASCQDHLEFYAAIRGLPKQAKWIEIYRDRFCRVLSGPFPSFPLLRQAVEDSLQDFKLAKLVRTCGDSTELRPLKPI